MTHRRASEIAKEVDSFTAEAISHMDALYGVACRLTRNPAEAEDLVQDALVKAMRARDQFHRGTNLKAWLFRILTNTFINKYRRGGLERNLFDGPDADPLADGWVSASTMRQLRDPEQVALLPLVEGEVRRALDTLPPDFRLAVILCDVEEFSYEEIARIMGCPLGTVMSRLHRGRKLLQRALYNHAVSMGIVKDAEGTARGAHERPDPSRGACERPDPSRAACERPEKKTNAEPADLAAYRQKKRGVA